LGQKLRTSSIPSTSHFPSESTRRLIPFIVAAPLFLQNLTGSILATALPSLAKALGSDVLHLNLAITLYLLSVALCLPLAAWLCERVGPRRLFCAALLIFSLGSILAALSQSLWHLAAARAFQGIGGAMMIPVGRLILLRSMPPDEIVKATIWYTVPPAIGAIVGPLVGGFVVTYLSWQWLFLINVPIALGACYLALRLLDEDGPGQKIPLDLGSYALMALALIGMLSGLAGSGKGLLPTSICITLILSGIGFSWLYLQHAKRATHPVMDFSLLRFPTFRASIVGGFGVRVGQGAAPFMLPLLFQIGFGLSPVAAGSLIFVSGVGSLLTRPVLTLAIQRYGFRNMLIGATIVCSLLYFGFALLRPGMSYVAMVAILLLNGASRGMLLVSMNTLGYTEIPKPKMSYATAMSTMGQQVSNTFGVAMAVVLLNLAMQARGSETLLAEDFWVGFVVLGILNALALFYFVPLPANVGAELTPTAESPP
jgi:EmrB/QacA subfamily drug resistance transporter